MELRFLYSAFLSIPPPPPCPFKTPALLWNLYEGFLSFCGGKGSECGTVLSPPQSMSQQIRLELISCHRLNWRASSELSIRTSILYIRLFLLHMSEVRHVLFHNVTFWRNKFRHPLVLEGYERFTSSLLSYIICGLNFAQSCYRYIYIASRSARTIMQGVKVLRWLPINYLTSNASGLYSRSTQVRISVETLPIRTEVCHDLYRSFKSHDSSVGIALGFGLDDWGSRVRFPSGLGIFLFTSASRTALGPTQHPIQWVPGALSMGVKRSGCEADHSPPFSAEVEEWVKSPWYPLDRRLGEPHSRSGHGGLEKNSQPPPGIEP
jgi:hypothetical protein